MANIHNTLQDFAGLIYSLLKSDRDVLIGVGGFTGEGKSTFSTKLCKEYAKQSGTYWGFDRMTWSRQEMLTWIDGDKGSEVIKSTGLKPNQLPEYSIILPDELFTMFYRRNWYDEDQIDAIATFNMCRDRHLLVIGNVPHFWDLDAGFTGRIRFYVYIPERGVAWVFEQENNPFIKDKWSPSENSKIFRKKKNPYSCPNFICQIEYDDWETEEKKDYYRIRNMKRLTAIDSNKNEKKERYSAIKKQRDTLIHYAYLEKPKMPNRVIAELIDMHPDSIAKIREGLR